MKMIERIRALKNKKTIQNSGWIIGERVFQMLITFVIGVISARYLGPSNYGALNYTASFVSFCSAIATLGMDGVVIKHMIENPKQEGRYLGGCIILRFISSVLCSFAIMVIVAVLNCGDTLKVYLVALQSLQLIFTSVGILDSWFQRYLNSKYVSLAKMGACLVVSAYKIYLLASSKSIIWFAFSNSLSSLAVGVLLVVFYKRNNGQKLVADFKSGRLILTDSYHFIISGIMSAIYGQIDKMMLGGMVSDLSVGFYTTASVLCTAWLFIPEAIITSFRPTIMEMKSSGNEKDYSIRLRQIYSLIMWLCIGVSVVVCILGSFAIKLLYGEAYMGALPVLRTLIWSETFAMIGSARGIWVLCEKKNKYVKYYLGCGAVTNVVLNFVLIPIYGENGAAIATLITQIITSLFAPMLFKETRGHIQIVVDAFLFKWRNDTVGRREN